MSEPEKIVFPCEYPIKVMGRADPDFRARVDAVFAGHFGEFASHRVSERASAQQNFTALTYLMQVRDATQLQALHEELKSCPGVVLVL
jgi:uncharacterized protein